MGLGWNLALNCPNVTGIWTSLSYARGEGGETRRGNVWLLNWCSFKGLVVYYLWEGGSHLQKWPSINFTYHESEPPTEFKVHHHGVYHLWLLHSISISPGYCLMLLSWSLLKWPPFNASLSGNNPQSATSKMAIPPAIATPHPPPPPPIGRPPPRINPVRYRRR